MIAKKASDVKTITSTVSVVKQDEGRYALLLSDNNWYNSFGNAVYSDSEDVISDGDSVVLSYKLTPRQNGKGNWRNIVKVLPVSVGEEVSDEPTSNCEVETSSRERWVKGVAIELFKHIVEARQIVSTTDKLPEEWLLKTFELCCRVVSDAKITKVVAVEEKVSGTDQSVEVQEQTVQ